MRFGVCTAVENEENLRVCSRSGFDYVEANFRMLATADDEKAALLRSLTDRYALPVEAANCFLPGDLKTCGSKVDADALRSYIQKGLSLGKTMGLQKVVFGSGGARSMEPDMNFQQAWNDNLVFLKEIALPLFEQEGITLVIEPLRRQECNFINTVKEAAMLAFAADSDHIGVLADIYHMKETGDSVVNIEDLKGYLLHAHISYPVACGEMKRCYPRQGEEYDYQSFLKSLRAAGCATCSIEAATQDFALDAPRALDLLRQIDKMLEDND